MFNAAQQEAFATFEDAKTYVACALKRWEAHGITNCLKEARPMLLIDRFPATKHDSM